MPLTGGVQDNAEELLQILYNNGPGNFVVTTYAAAVTLQAPNLASIQQITLTGNITLTLPAPIPGGQFDLYLIQDATGSRLATWAATSGAVKFTGGSKTLTTTAAAIDQASFSSDGVNWYGTLNKAMA